MPRRTAASTWSWTATKSSGSIPASRRRSDLRPPVDRRPPSEGPGQAGFFGAGLRGFAAAFPADVEGDFGARFGRARLRGNPRRRSGLAVLEEALEERRLAAAGAARIDARVGLADLASS